MEPNNNLPPPSTASHHHHDGGSATTICVNCGGPTAFPPPPPDPNPNYIPIRAPAVNLPPANNREIIMRTPVPQSHQIIPLTPPYHFQTPIKIIQTQNDIVQFSSSSTCLHFLGFIVSLSESIRSHKLSDHCHVSPAVLEIVEILQTLIVYIDEIPLAPQSSRYGNLAYRTWHERMSCDAESFLLRLLPFELKEASVELVPYFTDSFGNSSRIDYGTGHETNFAAWLYCLARLGVVKEEGYHALVSRVFVKYLELMRKLQVTYSLEPAGSHGVWGLDDYHFLPFIFGASQLIDHKYMKPKSIHNEDILENFANEYLYLSCIVFIKKVKKGLFAEHSPIRFLSCSISFLAPLSNDNDVLVGLFPEPWVSHK
ncbi:hypothetical protein K7X08_007904 [Anisodus acutangulus]|uniref:Serine/threonine-protein phosphatase 2A activator n=1 Tax=Anisodus acutangulus TaxID=402998 RepID=A0A9Q1RPF3_9SOLA|nr:hypothetical protein K7X08_007904 [Anisodus acutangulus]